MIGVEVHPATNGEVAAVIAKQQRSLVALQPHMVDRDVRWLWIASGKDTVARGSTEWRKLIQARIELVGRHLRLP